jgi:nucleotide-binding universal stress UspA family protein
LEVDAEARLQAECAFAEIDQELSRSGLISNCHIIACGDPAEEILKYADDLRVDLIAIGSHGRTGILRLIQGSVSQKVLDRAKCPVMTARVTDTRPGSSELKAA